MNNVITAAELMERRKGEHAPTVIDVRTRGEYDRDHLEGAIHMDISSSSFMSEVLALSKSGTYVFYCATGGRSSIAVMFMQDSGFENVYDLAGGIDAWCDAGLPTE